MIWLIYFVKLKYYSLLQVASLIKVWMKLEEKKLHNQYLTKMALIHIVIMPENWSNLSLLYPTICTFDGNFWRQ